MLAWVLDYRGIVVQGGLLRAEICEKICPNLSPAGPARFFSPPAPAPALRARPACPMSVGGRSGSPSLAVLSLAPLCRAPRAREDNLIARGFVRTSAGDADTVAPLPTR